MCFFQKKTDPFFSLFYRVRVYFLVFKILEPNKRQTTTRNWVLPTRKNWFYRYEMRKKIYRSILIRMDKTWYCHKKNRVFFFKILREKKPRNRKLLKIFCELFDCFTALSGPYSAVLRIAVRFARNQNWTGDTRIFNPLLYHWATPAESSRRLLCLLTKKKAD